jgi:hypothetical protein
MLLDLADGTHPSVASDGTNFLVAFRGVDAVSLRTLLISAAGEVTEAVAISNADSFVAADVAWTGAGYVIVFGNFGNTAELSLVSSDGRMVVRTESLPSLPRAARIWSIACDGIATCVVATDGLLTTIDRTARTLRSEPASWLQQPDVTWDGHRYLLARIADEGGLQRAAVLDVLMANGIRTEIARIGGLRTVGATAVASNGNETLLSWTQYRQFGVGGRTVSTLLSNGAFSVPSEGPFGFLLAEPDAVWTGERFVLVDYENATMINALGEQERLLAGESVSPPSRDAASTASRGAVRAIVYRESESWTDLGEGRFRYIPTSLRLSLVRDDVEVADVLVTHGGTPAAVAVGPSTVLVAWIDEADIRFMRYRHDGSQVDQSPHILFFRGDTISAAWNGSAFVVVTAPAAGTVEGRVPEFGLPIGSEFLSTGVAPVVGSNGSNHLVTWQRSDRASRVVQLLSATGFPVGPAIQITAGPDVRAAIASDGGDYVVFYIADEKLYGQRIDVSGRAAGVPVLIGSTNASSFAATWNGSQYIVVWRSTVEPRVYAQQLTRTLSLEGAPQGVTSEAIEFSTQALAATEAGTVELVYTRAGHLYRREIAVLSNSGRLRTIGR